MNHSGNCNNGTFKFDFQVPIVHANFTASYFNGCAPLTVQFNNQSTSGSHYLWDFGNNDTTSLINNPVKTYTSPGIYLVHLYVVDSSKCNITDSTYSYITVNPVINADFNYTLSPCGNTVQFTDSSYSNPVQWTWNFGDTNTGTTQNPSHAYSTPGTYSVTLISNNTTNCPDTITIPVTIANFNPVTINALQTICQNGQAQLSATGGIAYSWVPAATLSSSTISNPVATPAVTTTYSVTITTVNSNNDTCSSVLSTTVNVTSLAASQLITAANPDTIPKGGSSNLSSSLSAPFTINWTPPASLNNPNSFNPVATPAHTTTYTAMVSDANGCTYLLDGVTVYVIANTCDEATVFVPNTFTPNNDGKNDVLYVRSSVVQELYFAIYNRWGQMVFETNDISKGWDGVYKDMKADPGVFGYYLKVKCNNGDESFRKGNITLIR